jgi:hypothetical protein
MSRKQLQKSAPAEDFMTSKWRPMMAVMYMVTCVFDFVLFPILWSGIQFWETEAANDAFRQWNPITLGSGGLFHVAMGAVLGVSAWSRGQEKMAGATGQHETPPPAPTFAAPPAYNPAPTFAAHPAPGPAANNSWNTAPVATGWGGKKAPPEPEYPVIG